MYKQSVQKQSVREKELTELVKNEETQQNIPQLQIGDGISQGSSQTQIFSKTSRFQKYRQTQISKPVSKYLKQIIFCRHGQTQEGQNSILLGQLQGNLSKSGIEESITVGQYLKHLSIDIAYVSDLNRTQQTLKNINEQRQFEIENIISEPLLRDINLDIYAGTSLKNNKTYKVMNEINKDRSKKVSKKGESWQDVEKRAMQFWDNLVENQLKQTEVRQILIVGHRGILTSLLENIYLSDIKVEEKVKFFNMPMNYGEIIVLKTDFIDEKLTLVDFQRKQA